MTSLPNQDPLRGVQPAGGAERTRPHDPKANAATGGPAFRALLAELQERATALHESSQDVADPAELKGAVDAARATLQDALSLGDQVLEAYRSARATGGTERGEDPTTDTRGPRTD